MQIITRTVTQAIVAFVVFIVLYGCEKQSSYDIAIEQAKAGKIVDARSGMINVAESGDLHAMAWLMQDATNQGLANPLARTQFITWAEKCAEKGNATCAESAGIFYWSGIDGAIDFENAEKWIAIAKSNGSASAGGWLDDIKKRKPADTSIRKLAELI
jgi:TPR repeat protein